MPRRQYMLKKQNILPEDRDRLARKLGYVFENCPRVVAKIAVGFPLDEKDYWRCFRRHGSNLTLFDKTLLDILESIAVDVVENHGTYRCKLCGQTFTKRGLYFHLIRVHRFDIKKLVVNKIKKLPLDIPEELLRV